MAIEQTIVPIHWNYFLAIEQDMLKLSRYIEFDERNYGAYSIELARILFAASSECDVVAKSLCKQVEPRSKADNINQYQSRILEHFPNFHSSVVRIPRFGLTLRPWFNWGIQKDNPPIWWSAYNKVKHHRNDHFEKANLHNALNSVAGLFVLLLYYYIDQISKTNNIRPLPEMFRYNGNDGGDLNYSII